MPKRITIARHLSLNELENRYRQAKDPVERSHYQIIWLLASGRPTEEVAAITSYSRNWIYELVWGYNRVGPKTWEMDGIKTPVLNRSLTMCSKPIYCRH
jgi:hypothetical protein